MSDIHTLSEVIGTLNADVTEARRQRERIIQQLDDMKEDHADTKLMLSQHVIEFQLHTEEEMKKYNEINQIVQDYQSTKHKAAGVLMTIAFFGAAAWEGLKAVMHKLGI